MRLKVESFAKDSDMKVMRVCALIVCDLLNHEIMPNTCVASLTWIKNVH